MTMPRKARLRGRRPPARILEELRVVVEGSLRRAPGFSGLRMEPDIPSRRQFPVRGGFSRPRSAGALPSSAGRASLASALQGARGARGARAASQPTLTPEQRLIQRVTLGFNLYEQELMEEMGYDGYLEYQLNYEAIDDSELEDLLAFHLPSLSMSPAEVIETYQEDPATPAIELIVATIYRSLYSPRQLFERMVIFWSDHFNIDIFSDLAVFLKPTDDREVVRAHAMGRFPDLLWASAHSPAMLSYLTNDTNHKDHPNENYARELMELHTLGVDNGYTQEDVREVARCLTGWLYWGREGGPNIGRFLFYPGVHDYGSKVVLGQQIPGGGSVEDGETVLQILAGHPNTAQFISQKLLHYLWGYEPPQEKVDTVAQEYAATGGDLRSMLRVALNRDWMSEATPKLKRPRHLVISTLRALFAEASEPFFLWQTLEAMGHIPFTWGTPDGFPDSETYWSGFILPRWNFVGLATEVEASGVRFDLPLYDASLAPADIVQRIDTLVFNGTLSPKTRGAIEGFLAAGALSRERVNQALGLALSSPEFQQY